MSALAWLDGRIMALGEAMLPLADPAVLAGLVAFETVRVDANVPVRLDAHLARLRDSAATLDLAPPDLDLFARIAASLARGDGRLRLGWTGRVPFGILEAWDRTRMYAPIRAVTDHAPGDPIVWGTAKHTSRAGHVLRLRRSGADEVLLHREGRFTEGTWSAILGVEDGVLFTARTGVLPSITAAAYCGYARRVGIEVADTGPSTACPALYVVSSLRELCPVVELDGLPRAGWEPVGIRLQGLSVEGSGD